MRDIDFDRAGELEFLCYFQHDVLSRQQALRFMSPAALRHRLESGRWQHPHRAVVVTTTGALTREQQMWIPFLHANPKASADQPAALVAGRWALEVHGMKGFHSPIVDLLLPDGPRVIRAPNWARVHRTGPLPVADIHAIGQPPCTSPARSVVDAAQWAVSDNEARTVIAMAFQQGKVGLDEIHAVLRRMPRIRRARLIARTAADASGGAHSLAELDFLALSRRAGLPEPKLQAVRRDAVGKRRYLDVLYEEYGLHIEIDGAQHNDPRHAWADMQRQNEIWTSGVRMLRFPTWLIRERPGEVIAHVRAALIAAGWRPPA